MKNGRVSKVRFAWVVTSGAGFTDVVVQVDHRYEPGPRLSLHDVA